MLHEIFKGMDNAAEMIDENFKDLQIETSDSELGRYWKLPSGLMVSIGTFTHDFSQETSKFVRLPAHFRDTNFWVDLSSASGDWSALAIANSVAAGASATDEIRFGRVASVATTGSFKFVYIAIGRPQ